jgi:hypothetical protein
MPVKNGFERCSLSRSWTGKGVRSQRIEPRIRVDRFFDEQTLKCEWNGDDMMRKLSLILLTIVGVASAQAGETYHGSHGT